MNTVDNELKSSQSQKEDINQDVKKVLLVGYNGANNTGSEARLISIIKDVRAVLGPDVFITIPTLNEKNLRRYIKEEANLKIVPIPSIFFFAIRKLVKEHDLVLLVEGSCYMDTWTSALLWAFLWTTRCANSFKKPCVAYSVDVGDLSTLNSFFVKREASKTDLIITRTKLAADKLKKIGVTAPIKHAADSAFTFQKDGKDETILKDIWLKESLPKPEAGVVGFAVVDFYLWPVVIRPWGRSKDIYKWPYYFSRSKKRAQRSDDLAASWAALADGVVETHGKNIALVCMEELDKPLALSILGKMQHSENAYIFTSSEFNTSQMTGILQGLELLVTSRYHAAVLSLESYVPQIAVAHDPRLKGLYNELGIDKEYLFDCRPENTCETVWSEVKKQANELLENPGKICNTLKQGYDQHLRGANENRQLLKEFLIERGWKVKP
ncbi:polysaccharide pyruvyl transferase family protein [Methanobacterium aggregans]|uniref:polysaccharide pyruvyl transferase family protein n=2 Tax=Methanobacterium aggregans TaxID=1615586 RepID=UPI001FDAA02C|nr:polysaccharide pyruvyl transferase family protein [Methanobacterium aggregans]MBP2046392.1 polysaccharide pyruvyl transferase WcaK-like protein [Methanobacterium aggregans]